MNRKQMLTILLLLIGSVHASAQQAGHLNVTTTVQKEEVTIDAAGEPTTRLVAANTVVPGETVVYTISFQNIGDEPAANVVITNPISDDLTYVDGSAYGPGADLQFSIDGGSSFGPADQLTVDEDGTMRSAGPDDFTHIQWVMRNELAAGAQGTVRFKAVLK